jgi:hypothetical protein
VEGEDGALGGPMARAAPSGSRFVTADGLYVGAVFRNPGRDGGVSVPDRIARGASLNAMACPDEQWGDHFVQAADGRCMLFTGLGKGAPGVVAARMVGLDAVRRLEGGPLRIAADKPRLFSTIPVS